MDSIPIQDRIPELDLAIAASIEGGDVIREIYDGEFKVFTKSDRSPITEADLKSNDIIRKTLSKTRHRILSEEDADDKRRLGERTIWIVDPLDGTADFVDRTGEFTVMIALVQNKKPILGVINWPMQKTVFAAQHGMGAFKCINGDWQQIAVNDISDPARCRVVCSRHHSTDMERALVRNVGIGQSASIGSSLKVGKISSGEAEAYVAINNKIKEWDTAASYCIIHEAGGRMTDMMGNDITYNNQAVNHRNGILVTNGLIHDKILDEYAKIRSRES